MVDDTANPGALALASDRGRAADGVWQPASENAAPRRRLGRRQPVRELLVHAFFSRRLILAVATIPLLIGIVLAATSVRRYTADALLIVLLGRENTSSSDVTGTTPVNLAITGLKEVTSEIDIMTSDAVVDQALRSVGPEVLRPGIGKGGLFGLLPGMPPDEQIKASEDWFRDNLRAAVQDETNVLHVTFTHADSKIAVRSLQALIDAYLDHRRQVYANQTSGYLSNVLETTTKRLQEVDAALAAVKARYQIVDIAQDISATGARIDRIQRRRDELIEAREGVRARIAATQAQLAHEQERVFASNDISNQNSNDESRNTILRMQLERDHLASQYAPGFPPLAELDRKLASAREAAALAQRTNSQATRTARNPVWDTLNGALASARGEAAALDQQIVEVDAELAPALDRAQALREADTTLRTLQREHDVLDTNYRQFSAREAQARINEDAAHTRDANVHIAQPPTARFGGTSQRLSFLLAGIVGSVLMGCATALLSSQLRGVFLLPAEVERALDLPVLADMPVGPDGMTSKGGMPHVANLAAMLLDLARADPSATSTVIQVMGPEDDTASSTLVQALAVEFAVIHNIATLLIDLHPDGEGGALAAAQPTGTLETVGNLKVACTIYPRLCVALEAASSDLASSRALQAQSLAILTGLRARHEMILINATSPVGDYAARRLASLADGNLIVLQAHHTRQTAAIELCETLNNAGATMIGSVMLGVRSYLPALVQRWL